MEKTNIYIVFSLGIVGSGKSTVLNIINELLETRYKDYSIDVISSDKIRENVVNDYMKYGDSFDQSNNKVNKNHKKLKGIFDNKILEALNDLLKNNKKGIIYLDKNYSLPTIKNIVELLPKNKDGTIKLVCFYPNILYPINIDGIKFPLSLSSLIQCYLRIKGRKHETLDPEKNERFHYILFMFLNTYRGYTKFNVDKFDCINGYYINYYKLSNFDEREMLDQKNMLNILYNIYSKYNTKSFDEDLLYTKCNNDINQLIKQMEEYNELNPFKSTIDTIKEELIKSTFNLI
jgi:hypothetical protein